MSSGSGAGVRPIGAAGSISSPKAVKGQSSVKKKAKTAATTPKAAASSSSSSSAVPRVDHLSAASSHDTAAAAASAALTSQAHEGAFPLLHQDRPFNPEEEADEEIDEAQLQQQMEDMMKEDTVPPRPLTLEIIRQRCLPRDLVESGNQELITKKLFSLERIYLDGQSLSSIDDCFDLMSHSLSHVYLQRNALTSTHGFASLRRLKFLMLAHNDIRVLEGLTDLPALQFLDVSHNLIEELDTGDADADEDTCQLPESLVVFNCAGNPFTMTGGDEYKEHIATVSPYLKTMDGERITNRMRRQWGLDASDDDEEDDAALAADAAAKEAKRASVARKEGGQEEQQQEEEEEEEEEDADADGDDAADLAAYALRAEAEEMRKRSEQRTMLYDTTHGVSPATTQQDRQEALAEAARSGAGKQ